MNLFKRIYDKPEDPVVCLPQEVADDLLLRAGAGDEVYLTYDPKTNRVIYLSPAFERVWGLSREKVYASPESMIEAIHRDDLQTMSTEFERVQHEPVEREYRIVRPDGSLRWVRENLSPVGQADRGLRLINGVARDITELKWQGHSVASGNEDELEVVRNHLQKEIAERRHTEEALRESEELHRITLSNISDAVFITDDSGAFTFICPNVDIIFGYSHQEVEDIGNIRELLGGTLIDPNLLPAAGEIRNIEHEVKDKSCSPRTLLVHVKRVSIHGGTTLYVCRDITERKQAEEKLRFSEDKFSKAFQSSPDAFAISRQIDGLILDINESCGELFGYSRQEVVGQTVMDLQLYPSPSEREQLLALVRDQGSARDFEVKLRRKSGEIRLVSISAESIMLRNELCLMVIIRDITEQKQMEQDISESHARIEDLAGRLIVTQEEERRRIARELHDDLNQQVAALAIGLGKLDRQLLDANASIRNQVTKLEDRTSLLSEQIRRMSHELHSSTLEQVGLSEALKLHCSEFADQEGILVTLDIQDDIETIPADAALCLYRIAQESLRNIAKHSGAKIAEVILAGTSKTLELRIADHGLGFDQRKMSLRRGLGLISIEERVKLLHGSFEVKSQPGVGTELRVHLPLRNQDEKTASTTG